MEHGGNLIISKKSYSVNNFLHSHEIVWGYNALQDLRAFITYTKHLYPHHFPIIHFFILRLKRWVIACISQGKVQGMESKFTTSGENSEVDILLILFHFIQMFYLSSSYINESYFLRKYFPGVLS